MSIDSVVGFPHTFQLVGKNSLWINLVAAFGKAKASTLYPYTYILSNSKDRIALEKYLETGYPILLKNNKQKRKGLAWVQSYENFKRLDLEEFLVAQQIISESRMVDGRRFHIRYYVSACYINKQLQFFLYPKGKCLYARPNTENTFQAIVTQNRYLENGLPKTSNELKWLTDLGSLLSVLENVLLVVAPYLLKELRPNVSYFDLYGVDVLFLSDGTPMVIEFNRAPAMLPTHAEDKVLKYQVLHSFLEMVDQKKSLLKDWIPIQPRSIKN